MENRKFYIYKAKIVSVYDGDTVTAEVDLGFRIKQTMKLRLYGINAPEMRGPQRENGKICRDLLRHLILNKTVEIETIKDKTGKYGRMLAIIWDGNDNINELMVKQGWVVAKKY